VLFGTREHLERCVFDIEHAAGIQHHDTRGSASSINARIFCPTSFALAKKMRP
jgi:hypothetical protein